MNALWCALAVVCALSHCWTASASDELRKFIIFRINPGEGFNLRKDVLLRLVVSLSSMSVAVYMQIQPPRRMDCFGCSGVVVSCSTSYMTLIMIAARYLHLIQLSYLLNAPGIALSPSQALLTSSHSARKQVDSRSTAPARRAALECCAEPRPCSGRQPNC